MCNRIHPRWYAHVALLTLGAAATPGWSQTSQSSEDPEPAESAESRDEVSSEIVITAQRRAQLLQRVPMAVSALNEEALEERGIKSLTDVAGVVPGLAVTNSGPGTTRVSIRGLSSSGANLRESATIGYYLDDVPITLPNNSFNAQADPDLFDISRIEVLRGPQGTLFGSGSIGGTVRYIYNEPSLSSIEARGRVSAETVRHGGQGFGLNGMLNIPVLESRMGLRATGYYREDPGYVDFVHHGTGESKEDNNRVKTIGGRLSALAQIGDNIQFVPAVYYHRAKFDAMSEWDAALPGIQIRRFYPSSGVDEFKLYTGTARLDFGWANLTSITALYDRDYERQTDYSLLISRIYRTIYNNVFNPAISTFDITSDQFTQEVRLASSSESRLNWLAGVYYANTKSKQHQFVFADGIGQLVGGTLSGFDVSNDELFDGLTIVRDKQTAAFGEVSYELIRSLTATVGMRAFDASQRSQRILFGPLAGRVNFELSTEERGVVPRYLLSYQANNHLLYGSASKGFRTGGTNSPVPDACAPDLANLGLTSPPSRFESDSVWSYELGAKTSWFDRRVRLNAAAYHLKWDDIQQNASLPTCAFSFTGNAGKARSRGIELELTATPVRGVELTSAYGHVDAELLRDSPGIGAFKGDVLLEVPRHTISVGAQYTHQISSAVSVSVRGDYRYYGGVRQTYSRTAANIFRPSFEQVNARIGVEFDRWELDLFALNLFDERGVLSRSVNPDQFPIGGIRPLDQVTTRPRTFGVSLTGRY